MSCNKDKLIYLILFSALNFSFQYPVENALQTSLNLTIDIIEIKIKDIHENPLWDDRGEFYFYLEIGEQKIRLPANGEIKRGENQYITKSDDELEDEAFWHFNWTESGTLSRTITFKGYEADDGSSDDNLGTLSSTLDLTTFQFISENTNRKLENGSYHVLYNIKCAPVIGSSSHPDTTQDYLNPNVSLAWTANLPAVGILGYSYIVNDNSQAGPDDILEGTHTATSFTNLKSGSYWFHVKVLDKAAYWSTTNRFKINIHKSVDVSDGSIITPHFKLFQNYPNPFNASTLIQYQLSEANQVFIRIYNQQGQHIKTLHDGFQSAGEYQILWDGKTKDGLDMASGIYICLIKIGSSIETIKMTLLR